MKKPIEQVIDQLDDIINSNNATERPSESITLLMTTIVDWRDKLKGTDGRARLDGSKRSKHKTAAKKSSSVATKKRR